MQSKTCEWAFGYILCWWMILLLLHIINCLIISSYSIDLRISGWKRIKTLTAQLWKFLMQNSIWKRITAIRTCLPSVKIVSIFNSLYRLYFLYTVYYKYYTIPFMKQIPTYLPFGRKMYKDFGCLRFQQLSH